MLGRRVLLSRITRGWERLEIRGFPWPPFYRGVRIRLQPLIEGSPAFVFALRVGVTLSKLVIGSSDVIDVHRPIPVIRDPKYASCGKPRQARSIAQCILNGHE